MALVLNLKVLAIVLRVALDPTFSEWPLSAFSHLEVLFPDIGNRLVVLSAGFLCCEGSVRPSLSAAAAQVQEHLSGLATFHYQGVNHGSYQFYPRATQ